MYIPDKFKGKLQIDYQPQKSRVMWNWEWRPLLLRRYRFWFNRVKKKSRKTNWFHPSLRTPVYTFISLFHVVCLVAWIIVHFTNHKKPEPTQNVDVANTAVWTCRTMTVTLMISRRMIPRRKRRERPRKRMIKRTLNLKYSVEILNCNIKTFLLFKYS